MRKFVNGLSDYAPNTSNKQYFHPKKPFKSTSFVYSYYTKK
jgi:hypothetical protein